jgi:hypothetical protein
MRVHEAISNSIQLLKCALTRKFTMQRSALLTTQAKKSSPAQHNQLQHRGKITTGKHDGSSIRNKRAKYQESTYLKQLPTTRNAVANIAGLIKEVVAGNAPYSSNSK